MKQIAIGILAVVVLLAFWAGCAQQEATPAAPAATPAAPAAGIFGWIGTWIDLQSSQAALDSARRYAEATEVTYRSRVTSTPIPTATPVPTSTPMPTPTTVPALVQATRTLGDAIAPLILPGLGIASVAAFFVVMFIADRRSRAHWTPAGKVFERGGAYLRSGNMIGPGVVVETPSIIKYSWWWARRNLHRLLGMEFDELAPATETQVRALDKGATADQYAVQARAAVLADGLAGMTPKIPNSVTHLTLPQPVAPALPAQTSRLGADLWSVETARPNEQLELMTGLLHRLGLQAPKPAASTTYMVDAQKENL